MMFEYMTLSNNTSIAHSDMKADGTVKVYIEKPVDGGFHHATCFLPKYEWKENEGFSEEETTDLETVIHNNAHLTLEFSKDGGIFSAVDS